MSASKRIVVCEVSVERHRHVLHRCATGDESFANGTTRFVLMGAVSKAALAGSGLNLFKRHLHSVFGLPWL